MEERPDLTREKLERTRALMDLHATDALVTGYEDLIPGLQLPDPDDRHVLAAAIRGQADVIVTMNLRDFPANVVGAFGIEAQHPDEFVLHLLDLAPGLVIAAAEIDPNRVRATRIRNGIRSACSIVALAILPSLGNPLPTRNR